MTAKRLPRSFYARPSHLVARELLGMVLHRRLGSTELAGIIVETEAYASYDPASHSFRGKTPRNEVMFGEPGFSYVYFTYGMHFCFNVTCQESGVAEAVLIRAIEPIQGLDAMKARRARAKSLHELTNGPGKVGAAFGLNREQNGIDLVGSDELFLTYGNARTVNQIGISRRIGISVGKDYLWRFFLKDNPFVSKAKPSP